MQLAERRFGKIGVLVKTFSSLRAGAFAEVTVMLFRLGM
jgi:hypothetical protein